MRVITLGPEGTYSHRAAKKYSRKKITFADSIPDAFEMFSEDDTLILPIENMIRGTVYDTITGLVEHDLKVVGQIILPIHHALMAQQKTFKKITSHPQALHQCSEYLKRNYPNAKWELTKSTADGCTKAQKNKQYATVGHSQNAEKYGLNIIDKNIENFKHNKTRFVVIQKEWDQTEKENSILIIHPKKNTPGILFEILKRFKRAKCDLSKIESRPNQQKLGEYYFYIETSGDFTTPQGQKIIKKLEKITEQVQVLGHYS